MQHERSKASTALASALALGALVAGCAGAAAPAPESPGREASSTTRLTSLELGPPPRVGKVQRSEAAGLGDAGSAGMDGLRGDEPKRSERDLDGRRSGSFGRWK